MLSACLLVELLVRPVADAAAEQQRAERRGDSSLLRDLGLWRSDNLTVAGISGAAWFLAPFAYASADEACS